MADREDFATAVGQAIKAHVPDRVMNASGQVRLNSSGGLQHLVDGTVVTEWNSGGHLTKGTVRSIADVPTNKQLRFDAVGRLQYYDTATGTILFQVSPNGQVTIGEIPWARIVGAPDIPPPSPSRDVVRIAGPLGVLYARLTHAATVTVPLFFVGSSTTRGNYPKNVVSRIAAAYPSGGAEFGTVYADAPLASVHTGPGVAGYNAGRGGMTSATYVTADILDNLDLTQPVAIFHGIGSNDWANNVPPATFEANVRAAITAIDARVSVPHVHILMQQHTRAGSRTYPWDDYTAALRRIAEGTTDRVFVDLGTAIDRIDPLGADPFGYGAGDGIHMNALGEEALGELMVRALGVPGSGVASAQPESGARDVTDLLGITTGKVHLHVWRGWCWLNFNAVILSSGGNLTLTGNGFATVAPQTPVTEAQGTVNATSGAGRRVDISAAGRVRVLGATAGEQINGSVSWPMTRPTPAIWPGTATT